MNTLEPHCDDNNDELGITPINVFTIFPKSSTIAIKYLVKISRGIAKNALISPPTFFQSIHLGFHFPVSYDMPFILESEKILCSCKQNYVS